MTLSNRPDQVAGPVDLTRRQKEIIEFLCLGCTNQEISRFLGISLNTVKAHIAALYSTLDVGNRTEAVYRYRQLVPAQKAIVDGKEEISAVAILPFQSVDPQASLQLAAKRLAEVVSHRLSRWNRFPVIAQEVCTSYGPGDVAALASEAGATYVVVGELRVQEDQFHLNLRLLSTPQGRIHWAQVFDLPRELRQDDLELIGSHVAAVAMPELFKAEKLRKENIPSPALGAWDKVVRGFFLLDARTEANCRTALELFEAAVVQAPWLAVAHYGLSMTNYVMLLEHWAEDPQRTKALLLEHAKRCIRLEPDNPDSSMVLALSRFLEGEIDEAIQLLAESVRINPSSITGFNLLGQLHGMKGMSNEAVRYLQESVRLSTHTAAYSRNQGALAIIRFSTGEYADAAAACREGLLYDFHSLQLNTLLVSACSLGGDANGLAKACDNLGKARPDFKLEMVLPFLQAVHPVQREHFLRGLRLAGFQEDRLPED